MNVYQCVEHFDEEPGLHLLIDSLFGEQGADGGFPLPSGPDGNRQALLYDQYGLWILTQAPVGEGEEDHVRHFPYGVVTSCIIRQTEGVRKAYEDTHSSYYQRMAGVLRSTVLEVSISDSYFRFDGRLIASAVTNEGFFPEIVDDFFGIMRYCASYGVSVEAISTPAPALVGAGTR